MISVGLAGQEASWLASLLSICGKNFNVVIFLDAVNIINVKLWIIVVLIELYPFIPLSVTLIIFQGHSLSLIHI